MQPLARFLTRHLLGIPCTARNIAHTAQVLRDLTSFMSQVALLLAAAAVGGFIAWLVAALVFSL